MQPATTPHLQPGEERGLEVSLSHQIIARMLLVFSIILATWSAQLEVVVLCGPSADKHDLIDLTVHYLDLI